MLKSFCQKYLSSSAEKFVIADSATLKVYMRIALYIWNLDTGHQHPAGSKISGSCCPLPSSWKFNPVVTDNVTIDQDSECKLIHCFHTLESIFGPTMVSIYIDASPKNTCSHENSKVLQRLSLCTNLDSQSNNVGHLASTGRMERLPKILCNTTSKDAGKRLLWDYFHNVFSVMV